MTAQTLTPVAINTTGIVQTPVQITEDTATFAPAGDRDIIVIESSSGTVNVTAACVTPCNMPLACTASPCTDAGLHAFKMTATSAGGAKTFYIPYIEHYIATDTGLVTLTCDVKANTKIAILRMPA